MGATEDANALHRIFRSSNTAPHYRRLDQLLVNPQPNAVAATHAEYERRHGGGSFGRNLQAFCNRIQDTPQMQTAMRNRYVERLAQAGIIVYPGSGPAAAAIMPTAQNRPVWRQRWEAYFTTGAGQNYQPNGDKLLILWILRNWDSVRTGALSQHVHRCGWQPQENQLFRASFSFLSQDARARELGTQEGISYFTIIAAAFHTQLLMVLRDATNYQEVYVARCHPFFQANPSAAVPPMDNTHLIPRMNSWVALHQNADPIPLHGMERRCVIHFQSLVNCWRQNPSPIHTCSTEAGRLGIQTIGAGP